MKWLNILIVLLVVVFVSLMFSAETQKEGEVAGNFSKTVKLEK